MIQSLKDFLLKCARVWAVMRKPTKEELKTIAIASGLGIILLGAIGFAVSVIIRLSGFFG